MFFNIDKKSLPFCCWKSTYYSGNLNRFKNDLVIIAPVSFDQGEIFLDNDHDNVQ